MYRTTFFAVALLLFFLSTSCSRGGAAPTQQPRRSVDTLAKEVFLALKNDSLADFKSLMATPKQLRGFSDMAPRMEKDLVKGEKSFAKIRRAAKNAGVTWEAAEFVDVNYRVGESRGIKGTDAEMTFSASGKRYVVILNNCMELEGQWVLTSRLIWSSENR